MADTPLMQQYSALKAEAGDDTLLLFRMGDFYELFGDDAVKAAGILEITLTSRDKKSENPIPMAGVPHHSIQSYLQKLLDAGFRVAMGDQVGNPAETKGIVERRITRTFTPAIQFDQSSGSSNRYLATAELEPSKSGQDHWIVLCLDAATGEVRIRNKLSRARCLEILATPNLKHLILSDPALLKELPSRDHRLVEALPENYLRLSRAKSLLQDHYQTKSLDAVFPTDLPPSDATILGLGKLVQYVLKSQNLTRLLHLRPPQSETIAQQMTLGPQSWDHLDLEELLALVDQTGSSLGARKLRNWLERPLCKTSEILDHQAAVRELTSLKPQEMRRDFREIYDIERLMGRFSTGLAQPRDALALGVSLSRLPPLLKRLSTCQTAHLKSLLMTMKKDWALISSLAERLVQQLRSPAPVTASEGGIFQKGVSSELDRLIEISEEGESWLIKLEERERKETGIASLKVKYNRVFGYFIEVTKANLKSVPERYQRKQSMVNAERFFTEELKTFEEEIASATLKRRALESKLFEELTKSVLSEVERIMRLAQCLGKLDALTSLASLREWRGWNFPLVDDSMDLDLQGSRHPLIEKSIGSRFVPNHVFLDTKNRILLITGPNMGGKSTLMRQVALTLILGQLGAPVPAKSARWGVFSSIYTRIGAQDAISQGRSTFMVEMSELAHLLRHSNERSLLVLDEIGRGTSTYDGMSVAWATIEWIHETLKSRTLFATHYHELTELSQNLDRLKNAHLAVEGSRDTELRFQYRLKDGPSNESFGIQVGQIAGLPKPVIDRAWEVLAKLEAKKEAKNEKDSLQLPLFPSGPPRPETPPPRIAPSEIEQELKRQKIEELTPLEALCLLADLKKKANKDRKIS